MEGSRLISVFVWWNIQVINQPIYFAGLLFGIVVEKCELRYDSDSFSNFISQQLSDLSFLMLDVIKNILYILDREYAQIDFGKTKVW